MAITQPCALSHGVWNSHCIALIQCFPGIFTKSCLKPFLSFLLHDYPHFFSSRAIFLHFRHLTCVNKINNIEGMKTSNKDKLPSEIASC